MRALPAAAGRRVAGHRYRRLRCDGDVLYWAKGVVTREAVRMAIGQLPDYSPGKT